MTTDQTNRPCPDEEQPQGPGHENARLWLRSIDPDTGNEERQRVNQRIDDALILLAAVAHHTAGIRLQSGCAESDRMRGDESSRQQRLGWIRNDAEMALQCYQDLEHLCHRTPGRGGPAGAEMAKELRKTARTLMSMAQEATQESGEEINLFHLRLAGVRSLPASQPAVAVP